MGFFLQIVPILDGSIKGITTDGYDRFNQRALNMQSLSPVERKTTAFGAETNSQIELIRNSERERGRKMKEQGSLRNKNRGLLPRVGPKLLLSSKKNLHGRLGS